MVRSFILNPEQRKAIKDYMANRQQNMPGGIRSIRHRLKTMDFDEMAEDIVLLRKLNKMKVPIGRRSNEVKAAFDVKQPSS